MEEDEVECRPERIPRKCLDDNVCIGQIRKYFSFDAWNLLEATLDTMRTQGSWTCSVCHNDLHSSESICCDGCLDWVHLKCTGLRRELQRASTGFVDPVSVCNLVLTLSFF